MLPFELIVDLNQYRLEKQNESLRYKKLEDFIWWIKKDLDDNPSFKSLIWSLESRDLRGKYYGVLSKDELKEQIKIMKMFLSLSYWN